MQSMPFDQYNFCYGTLPDLRRAARSCKKPRKGAKPVPGPTMMIGVLGLSGSLKLECLTKMGSLSPTDSCFSQLEQTPKC